MRVHTSVIVLVLIQLLFLYKLSDGCPSRRRRCSPRNCVMSRWSSWSRCSATCGSSGRKTRTRRVLSGASCGGSCYSTSQSASCPGTCCPIPCSYSWMSWSSCSATCRYGTRKRYSRVWRNPYCRGTSCPTSPQTQRCGNGRYYAIEFLTSYFYVAFIT